MKRMGDKLEEEFLDTLRWFYIYINPDINNDRYILIAETKKDEWAMYYLDKVAATNAGIADVSGLGDLSKLKGNMKSDSQPTPPPIKPKTRKVSEFKEEDLPDDFLGVPKYDLFRQIEKKFSKNKPVKKELDGCLLIMKIRGNIGAIAREFIGILK